MNGLLLQPGREEEGCCAPVCILSRDGRLSLFPVEPPPPPASLRLTPAWSVFALDWIAYFIKAYHDISRGYFAAKPTDTDRNMSQYSADLDTI